MAPSPKKPVMDVSKPGGTRADATARPIIIGHEVMKDPMVTVSEDTGDTSGDRKELTAPSVTHKVIAPISGSTTDDRSEEPQKQDATEESLADNTVVDAVLEQVDDKKIEDWRNEEDRKREELVEKLVEEKKYFLPIDQVRSRRNNKILIIIFAVMLPVAIGLVLAVDAGVIKTNITLPFDLIK